MSKFIKLTSLLINTQYINKIIVKPNIYHIYLLNHKINGNIIFSIGWITSQEEEIIICSNKEPTDFTIITDWINTL
jgi:hypothetical protein